MSKSEEKNSVTMLLLSKENLRTIFDRIYDAIIIHDLQGSILDVNKTMLELYKIDAEKVKEMTIVGDLSGEDNPVDQLPLIWERVLTGEDQFFEWKAKSPSDGSIFDVEVYLTRISLQDQDIILAAVRDISEKKKSEQLIRHLSFHDKLTGLYNRAFFEKELQRLDTERQLPLSIIIGDINGLKLTNDAFGHLEGDELLKRVSEALKMATRNEDIVARWGGDEFAIILSKSDTYEAVKICERIQNMCMIAEAKPIPLSIALGYATKTQEAQDISDIIKDAETCMYTNKLKEGKENRQRIIHALIAKQDALDHNMERIIKLGIMLAQAYGVEESKMDHIKTLASIHDIGKASVPREILLKPSALTDKEWVIVKKHSEVGYRIASTYAEYAHVANDILCHHERWDGHGYPRGLTGEEIPIMARVLAIVDAYDVIISGRPYKIALEHKEAVEEIERHGGSQFDPELTKLFTKLMLSQ